MSSRPESSKKAAKRTKREILSIQATLRNEANTGIHISEEHSNDFMHNLPNAPSQDEQSSSVEEPQKAKKKHVLSKYKTKAKENRNRVEVKFNERGQPIEEESVKLSSFLGTLGREMVPLTYDDWRKVPQEIKDHIWEVVTQKFILNEGQSKKLILQTVGRLWRAYKSRLMGIVEDCETEEDLTAIKPDNIDFAQWETFIKHRSSTKFMEKRSRFKEMRAEQDLPHTCSRKGYARLEDDMKKDSLNPSSITRVDVWSRAHVKKNGEPSSTAVAEKMKKMKEIIESSSSNASSPPLKYDALSQVLGPDRNGLVRGVGAGVTPSKLGLISHHTSKIDQLEQKMKQMEDSYEQKMQRMESLIKQLLNNQGQDAGNEKVIPTQHASTSQSGINLREGCKCKLKNWMMSEDIVADARWVTNDPNTMVHCVPLGPNASKVWVDEAKRPLALLWRSASEILRIGDAVGRTIAWPTDHIIMVED